MCRDGFLHAHVAVRSNDAIWGFSGINAFEWSLLLEMLSYWLGVQAGRLTFSVTSSHIYEYHYARAESMLAHRPSCDVYERKSLTSFPFQTGWEDLPAALAAWFSMEVSAREGALVEADIALLRDPLLQAFLRMMVIYWAIKRGADRDRVLELAAPLGGSDLYEAVLEYASRKVEGFDAYDYDAPVALAAGEPFHIAELESQISKLHSEKTKAYGDSWKRRGELIGVMANIARKVDRLQSVDLNRSDLSETALDTAVDLFVYAVKYATYLMDIGQMSRADALVGCLAPLSDGTVAFDLLLSEFFAAREHSGLSAHEASAVVRKAYEALEREVEGDQDLKVAALEHLIGSSLDLVVSIATESHDCFRRFREVVEGLGKAGDSELRPGERQAEFFARHNRTRRFSYD